MLFPDNKERLKFARAIVKGLEIATLSSDLYTRLQEEQLRNEQFRYQAEQQVQAENIKPGNISQEDMLRNATEEMNKKIGEAWDAGNHQKENTMTDEKKGHNGSLREQFNENSKMTEKQSGSTSGGNTEKKGTGSNLKGHFNENSKMTSSSNNSGSRDEPVKKNNTAKTQNQSHSGNPVKKGGEANKSAKEESKENSKLTEKGKLTEKFNENSKMTNKQDSSGSSGGGGNNKGGSGSGNNGKQDGKAGNNNSPGKPKPKGPSY